LYYNVQQGVNGKITLCIEIKARDGKLQFLGAIFKRLAVNDDRRNKNRATTTAVKAEICGPTLPCGTEAQK
jgi:hypothetical protein